MQNFDLGIVTSHCSIRQRERGISDSMLDILLAYGRVDFKRSAEVIWMDKESIKELKSDQPSFDKHTLKKLSKLEGIRIGRTLITTYFRW